MMLPGRFRGMINSLIWYLVLAIEPFCCTEMSTHTYRMLPFYRATRMHSADYAEARRLSVRSSVRHTPVFCPNG